MLWKLSRGFSDDLKKIWHIRHLRWSQRAIFRFLAIWNLSPSYSWLWSSHFHLNGEHFFYDKGFRVDFPVGEDSSNIDWTLCRLSLSYMKYLKNVSSRLRPSCNFHADVHQYTDYARRTRKALSILFTIENKCTWFGFLNVRGNECRECTALTSQREGRLWL